MNRRIKVLTVAICAFILWIAVAPSIGHFLIVRRAVDSAEAIIVMSGSAVYRERCRKAAELYRAGIAPVVYLSDDGRKGGWSNEERRNPFFVELARREMVANHVPPEAIRVLPGYVSGTSDEAAAFAREIDIKPQSSILIVTSPYHTRRTVLAFERFLVQRDVKVGIEHTNLEEMDSGPAWWWTSTGGISDVVGEYLKLAAYWAYL